MALILPGQQEGGLKRPVKASTLILPGKTSPEDAAVIQTRRARLQQSGAEAAAAEKEAASAANAAKFLNVLGTVAKTTGQGMARSFLAAGAALGPRNPLAFQNPLKKTTTPGSDVERAIFGTDKPVSAETIGDEFSPLLESAGVSPETAKKIAPYTGLFIGALDIFPGTPGKKQAAELFAEKYLAGIAKETNPDFIYEAIKPHLKGGDAEIKALSEALSFVKDPAQVQRVIEAATTKPKSSVRILTKQSKTLEKLTLPEELKEMSASLVKNGYSKSEFLARFGKALSSTDADKAARAKSIQESLKEAGFTPGKFYDAAHGIPVERTGGISGVAGLRKVGIGREESMITRPELSLIRERLQATARDFKAGSLAARTEVGAIQKEVTDLIVKNLPPSLRGALLITVRNANRPSKLEAALRAVEDHIIDYQVLKAQSKRLGTARSRIGFIRKVGAFNQTAVQDVKRSLGIDKPLRKMNEFELKKVSDELSKRLQFKHDEGLLPSLPRTRDTSAPDAFYDQFSAERASFKDRAIEEARSVGEGIKNLAEEIGGIISTRLANIDPTLKYSLRKFEYNIRQTSMADRKPALALAEKTAKMNKIDRKNLDVAMKNGLTDDIDDLARQYGFESELKATRDMLNRVYARANEVKLDVAYRKDFFPRTFKQDSKTARAVLDYFERNDKLGTFEKAFRKETAKFGRPLTDIEKMDIVNTMLRGFQRGGIGLSKTGSLKNRMIETVTPELNDLYQDSFVAMFKYIESVNNLIESRRFFGKHLDLKSVDPKGNVDDIVGAYVNNLVSANKISSGDQLILQKILAARFSGKGMNAALGALKDVGYLSVMSSPLNALTQLGDLGFAFYRAGAKNASTGVYDALKGTKLTKEDLGIADIQAEFSDKTLLSEGVSKVFKWTGLNRVDRLGKETFINGTYRSLVDEVAENPTAVERRLSPIFGDETARVLEDIKSGDITENVKYLLFNELLDYQPIALSEVPIKYLEAPNGRVLYALKTYTLKLFDVYRREVIQQMKTDPKQGAKNLVRLSAYLMLFNATAQQLKNALTGKEVDLPDASIDAMVSAYGFNRYFIGQIVREGLGSAVGQQILPPFQLVDDVTKDSADVLNPDKDIPVDQFRSIQNLPVGGKLFYWWFGRGATAKEKAEKKTQSSGPSVRVPSVKIPTVRIPTVSI